MPRRAGKPLQIIPRNRRGPGIGQWVEIHRIVIQQRGIDQETHAPACIIHQGKCRHRSRCHAQHFLHQIG